MTPAALRAARLRLGLTQTALGALMGVSIRAVQNWEYGARPIPPPIVLLLARLIADAPAGGVERVEKRGRPNRMADNSGISADI